MCLSNVVRSKNTVPETFIYSDQLVQSRSSQRALEFLIYVLRPVRSDTDTDDDDDCAVFWLVLVSTVLDNRIFFISNINQARLPNAHQF